MKLFKRRGRKKNGTSWQPAWTYDTGAMVWRMKISQSGEILLEIRDTEKKEAWFSCLDETSGAELWSGLRLDEPWWIGVEDMEQGRLFLHGFRKPDMPRHLGIHCYDLRSGELLWKNDNLTFLFALRDEVYASHEGFEEMTFYALDANSGEIAKSLGADTDALNALRSTLNEEDLFLDYLYPEPFDSSHPDFAALRDRVYAVVPENGFTGNLDVLGLNSMLMISWHGPAANGTGYDQHFKALDNTDAVLRSDIINSSVQQSGIDSFFVKSGRVMYIKDKQILTVLEPGDISQPPGTDVQPHSTDVQSHGTDVQLRGDDSEQPGEQQ